MGCAVAGSLAVDLWATKQTSKAEFVIICAVEAFLVLHIDIVDIHITLPLALALTSLCSSACWQQSLQSNDPYAYLPNIFSV